MYIVSIVIFIYYALILAIPGFRRGELLHHTRSKCKTKAVDDLKHNWNNLSTIGNWFILCQIGRNSNAYFFRQFLSNLGYEDIYVKVDKENLEDNESKETIECDTLSRGEPSKKDGTEKERLPWIA